MEPNNAASNEGLNNLGYEQSLKRVLNLRNLVFFGISYLAPTVIFNQYGVLTQITQGMMALSTLITVVAVMFTAYSYSQMVKVYPVAGSAYTYVQRTINPHLGFLTGWVVLLDYLLIPLVCYLTVGLYMNRFVPQVPVWVWIIISVIAMTIINVIGIQSTARFNTVIMVLQFAFTLVFIAVVIKFILGGGGAGTLISPINFYDPQDFTRPGLFGAAAIMAISFLGFDAVTTVAEEAIEPQKNIGRAIFIICIGAGIVFTFISYISQVAWPDAWKQMSDPMTGIFDLFDHMKTGYMSTTFLVIDNCASLACALTAFTLVNISVIFQYVVKDKKRGFTDILKYLVVPVCGAIDSVYLFVSIAPLGKIVGGYWLLIGVIYSAATTNFWRKLPPELNLDE